MSEQHIFARIIASSDKLIVANKCVCLERKCLQKHKSEAKECENFAPTMDGLTTDSIVHGLFVDEQMTQLYHSETAKNLRCSLTKFDSMFTNQTVYEKFADRLAKKKITSPMQWDQLVAKCRSIPHLRTYVSSRDMVTVSKQLQEYLQCYVGGIQSLYNFQISYDPVLQRDVATQDIEIPLKFKNGDIFYDFDVSLALDEKMIRDFKDLAQIKATVGGEHAKYPYGCVELKIGSVRYERVALTITETGLMCRMMKRGVPNSFLFYMNCFLAISVPITPVFGAKLALPSHVQYRCSAMTFREPLERKKLLDMTVCVQSDDLIDTSPFVMSSGTIARLFTKDCEKTCASKDDLKNNQLLDAIFGKSCNNSDDDDNDDSSE